MTVIAVTWALLVAGLAGRAQLPVQAPPPAPLQTLGDTAVYHCDPDGLITCTVQQNETVVGSRSLEDMRIVGEFIRLIADRNRRLYSAWGIKAPSAAFELVKRVESFPYMPYDDTYSITGVTMAISQAENRVTVSYPKKPKGRLAAPVAPKDLVSYSTKLSDFIKVLEAEIAKLKKKPRASGSPR